MTLVCDQCGHVAPHDRGPSWLLPFQPKGTTAHVDLQVAQCRNPNCFCDRFIARDLLPTEPAL